MIQATARNQYQTVHPAGPAPPRAKIIVVTRVLAFIDAIIQRHWFWIALRGFTTVMLPFSLRWHLGGGRGPTAQNQRCGESASRKTIHHRTGGWNSRNLIGLTTSSLDTEEESPIELRRHRNVRVRLGVGSSRQEIPERNHSQSGAEPCPLNGR